MKYIDLKDLGLAENFIQEAAICEGLYLARVSEQHRDLYKIICEKGEIQARVSGKFSYNVYDNSNYPVVGDWVLIDRLDDNSGDAIIHKVLERKSVFERKAPGTSNQRQIIAANIDVIFICMSLNNDFNIRRLERYLAIAWSSRATPIIVLTKSDLCDNLTERLAEVHLVGVGTDIIVTSSLNPKGYNEVFKYIQKDKTTAFVGSSGVGKSTLINRLIGKEMLTTKEIRSDDKGRHTTTHRQLIMLPKGGIVIDTPGMRELQIDSADLGKSFEDIEELAMQCKFRNCNHRTEPGCAVQRAIEDGYLSEERLQSYRKLQKEIKYGELNSRELEHEKINQMFGGMSAMKQTMKHIKNKNKRR